MLPKFIFQAEENLVEKPWGGNYIARLKGIEAGNIGESWEFSAHPSRPSKVAINGVAQLTDLIAKFKDEIINGFEEFPILVKIIDANEDLSVQVHPSEEQAKMLGEKDHGKPEAWVVLDADEGAKIYLGFKEDVEPEEFRKAIERNENILEYLNAIEVKKGDAFYIPAGTIHALGRGVRVLEVSTNSNITYRIYDYGRGRELHLDKAFKVLNFKKMNVEELRQKPKRLDGLMRCIDAPFFKVDRIITDVKISKDTFQILLCVNGKVSLKSDSDVVEVTMGKSVLIPAITKEYEVEIEEDAEAYVVSPAKI